VINTPETLWVTKKEPTAKSPSDESQITPKRREPSRISQQALPSLFVKPYVKEMVEFGKFAELGLEPNNNDMKDLLQLFAVMKEKLALDPKAATFTSFFPSLCRALDGRLPDKHISLLKSLEARAATKEYQGNSIAAGQRVVVLGGGPCGLRLAIELQLLGARTTVLERRQDMTRNNVLRLWPFVMADLKNLGLRKLYSQLELGDINHISIRMLQLLLLKVTLLLGVEVRTGETFKSLEEPEGKRGWRVVSEKGGAKVEQECDMVLCATGSKVPIDGFSKKKPNFKLAIAITANFKRGLHNEMKVGEIAGVTCNNQVEYFNSLNSEHGIGLENIVYFRDLTNYFVMTAKKESLLTNGVLKNNLDKDSILNDDNKDMDALKRFALKAAMHSTENSEQLKKENSRKLEKSTQLPCTMDDLIDVNIFNFSELYSSAHASKVLERGGHRLVLGLVGDSLMQPFWPEGLGISRGFLSVWDTAWMVSQLCLDKDKNKTLEVITEREKLYSLQKTADNKLQGNHHLWSIDPATRYPRAELAAPFTRDVEELYDQKD
jgi:hypothetical protein